MINGKSVLTIIPARGGSKGVPRKNIRSLAGQPLIAWSIQEAKKSSYIDRIILSTDDPDIAAVAGSVGCEVPFLRPAALAQDETPGIEPVIHVIENLQSQYDYVVLLQPTSPLRIVEDIDGCIAHMQNHNAPLCVTVCEAEKSPYLMYKTDALFHLTPLIPNRDLFTRRQDMPLIYTLNGAVYAGDVACILKCRTFLTPETIAYIMPKERSFDIDTELDLKVCEYLLLGNINK